MKSDLEGIDLERSGYGRDVEMYIFIVFFVRLFIFHLPSRVSYSEFSVFTFTFYFMHICIHLYIGDNP